MSSDNQSQQTTLSKIEKYRQIILSRTKGQSPSRQSLLILGLMSREVGKVADAILRKKRRVLEEKLNNLVICIYCLASIFNLKIMAFKDDEE